MADIQSGMFSVREFNYRRNVLRIAPDAFITISDAINQRVISPIDPEGSKITDTRGGIASINVSCSVSPAGSSRATIEIIAPQYKGLHVDYYTTLPNGAKVPIFTPMMEIKIYMKGRYLEQEYEYSPRYYPVFWGMIVGVQENYNAGASTFSLTCEDLLCWWKYQKVTLQSGVITAFYHGAKMDRFPSTFQNMSPWEIILALFSDTFFTQYDASTGIASLYNMLYPQWSNIYQPPAIKDLKDTWSTFSQQVVDYWNTRFGFRAATSGKPEEIAASLASSIPLEMYGMRGAISLATVANRIKNYLDPTRQNLEYQSSGLAEINLDYGMLARVQPYGLFDLYGDGSEPQILSKLEIANVICEKVNMEFFVDTTGSFVFKPPLYNLDVATGDLPYYKIGPEDIINFNSNFDSNAVINYLVVTGPLWQQLKLEAVGLHADFDSIKKFGIRSEQISVSYGMNAEQLRMIAVAEMARRNGQAHTGSLSTPLRPEMRLGYPVYLPHIDTFYYVTGISHSYTYGSAATTDLSLQYRRERIFEDGTTKLADSKIGDVLTGCVFRQNTIEVAALAKANIADQKAHDEAYTKLVNSVGLDTSAPDYPKKLNSLLNEAAKQQYQNQNRLYSGPNMLGYWRMSKAEVKPAAGTVTNPDNSKATVSNELLMITPDTVPYTDKNGYRHIGAFPFGANLVVMKNGQNYDATNAAQAGAIPTLIQIDATGTPATPSSAQSNTVDQGVQGKTSTEGVPTVSNQPNEFTEAQMTASYKASQKSTPNQVVGPFSTTSLVRNTDLAQGIAVAQAHTLLDAGSTSADPANSAVGPVFNIGPEGSKLVHS